MMKTHTTGNYLWIIIILLTTLFLIIIKQISNDITILESKPVFESILTIDEKTNLTDKIRYYYNFNNNTENQITYNTTFEMMEYLKMTKDDAFYYLNSNNPAVKENAIRWLEKGFDNDINMYYDGNWNTYNDIPIGLIKNE